MPVSDCAVHSDVRRVLSRHWVDLRPLRLTTAGGRVRLRGELWRTDRSPHAYPACLIESLETELRRVPGVRGVYLDLTNWTRAPGGEWRLDAAAHHAQQQLCTEDEVHAHHLHPGEGGAAA